MLPVWIIVSIFIFLLATLPLTYNWVSKRGQYFARLHSIGFQENDRGLILKLEEPAKPIQDFFSADPNENLGDSKNPGLAYSAGGATMLIPNAIIGLFKFFVYQRRIWRQSRIYNQAQLGLLKQMRETHPDLSRLKEQMTKEFFSS